MKRTLLKVLIALAWIGGAAEAACGQTTSVTAPSGSITMGGSPIVTGTAVFLPVDVNGNPIAVTKSGGGLNLPGSKTQPVGYLCSIANGAITGSCSVPDEIASSPSGLRYNVTITDTSTGNPTSGDSFTIYQVQGVTGTSYALNNYAPNYQVSSTFANTFTSGSGAPSTPCGAVPSVYIRTDVPSLYICPATGGAWVNAVGAGGSSVLIQVNGTAVAIQSILNLKAGSNVTLTPDSNGGVTIAASGGSSTASTPRTNATSTDTITSADLTATGGFVSETYAGAVAVSLPATTGIASGSHVTVKNLSGSGYQLTITPASGTLIDGQASLSVDYPGDVNIVVDGANYKLAGGNGVRGAVNLSTPNALVAVLNPGVATQIAPPTSNGTYALVETTSGGATSLPTFQALNAALVGAAPASEPIGSAAQTTANAASSAASSAQTTANSAASAAAAAQATANAAIPSTQKAAASGVATLDGTGNVPANQLGNATGKFVPQWTVVGTHTLGEPLSTVSNLTNGVATSRVLEGVPFGFSALKGMWCNRLLSQSGSSDWNTNGINVDAQWQWNYPLVDDNIAKPGSGDSQLVTFGGNNATWIPGGTCTLSDPIPAGMQPNQGLYHYVKTGYAASPLPAPTGATLTPATGGFFAATGTNYNVEIVYDDPAGGYSLPEVFSSQQPGTGYTTWTITSPTAVAGVKTYTVYTCLSSATLCNAMGYQHIPIGKSITMLAGVANTLIANVQSTTNTTLMTATIPTNIYTQGDNSGSAGQPLYSTGEGYSGSSDAVIAGSVSAAQSGPYYGPTSILALPTAPGAIGLGIVGDSTDSGTDDCALFGSGGAGCINNQVGGYADRAALNQTTNYIFNPQIVPNWGYLNDANYGELFSTLIGNWKGPRAQELMTGTTTILSGYEVNDINSGYSATLGVNNVLTLCRSVISAGKRCIQTSIFPRVLTSTNAYQTVAGQSFSANSNAALFEGRREQFNTCVGNLSSACASTVHTNEVPFSYAAGASFAYNYNFHAGGDGTTTTFLTAAPFLCPNAVGSNTEVVKISGSPTTAYTYYDQQVLVTGQTICGGVTMTAAPAAGTLTITYTSMPSLASLLNGFAPSGYPNASYQFFDKASYVECNSTGVQGTNGGLWCPIPSAVSTPSITAHAVTGYTSTNLTASGGFGGCATTVDGCRGYFAILTGGGCGSNSIGANVLSNTTTQLTIELSTSGSCTPNSSSTVTVYPGGNTLIGVHALPYLQMQMAAGLVASGKVTPF